MKQKPSPSEGMHRREFLMLGSVATVGIAASLSASTETAFAGIAATRPQLSIGFAEPAADGAPQRLRAADALRSGDSDFVAGDARVTVHGLWRPERHRQTSANVAVSVFYALGDTTIPFIAWQHSGRSGAARVSFTTPVHENGTLPIGIEHSRPFSILRLPAQRLSRFFRATPDAPELPVQETLSQSGALCSLAAGSDRGLKLRRGTYFVALLDGDREPNWNAITAVADRNVRAEGLLHAGTQPVDFDYLVISIDRA